MNRHFASAISLATATAAIACAAVIASSKAYAETPTIDNTPFVSSRSRAEVRDELMSQAAIMSAAGSEWKMQLNHATDHHALTRRISASKEQSSPASALAITVGGLASHT